MSKERYNQIISDAFKNYISKTNEFKGDWPDTMEEFITFYETKYPAEQLLISIPRALTYFDDAENSPNPECLLGLSWEDVKNKIRSAVRDYLS